MASITLPNNWEPRDYQRPVFEYLENGGKHAELCWHRRAGKDDVCLNWTAVAGFERQGNYWHMLPKANQVRKAIWEAVNPRTGKRRIDEAFPEPIRKRVRDNDMFIELINGTTWQALGSDNYEGAIGSSPCGIVYSEWAQANPLVRGYLNPILADNDGWEIYIGTPRGKNHAYRTLKAAEKTPGAFAQTLPVTETHAIPQHRLDKARADYIDLYGEAFGEALYEQEYECSFDAAIPGAYYAVQFKRIEQEKRITDVPHDPDYKVHCVMDLGFGDDTAIWWYQVIAGEVRIIDYYIASGEDPDHFCSQILGRPLNINIIGSEIYVEFKSGLEEGAEHRIEYEYEQIEIPHDGLAKTLAAKGKSIQEQFSKVFGNSRVRVVPGLSIEDGIRATRNILNHCWFDETRCRDGVEAVKQYRREWDTDKRCFKKKPEHDWTSHPSDALRYLAIMVGATSRSSQATKKERYSKKIEPHQGLTFAEVIAIEDSYKRSNRRI